MITVNAFYAFSKVTEAKETITGNTQGDTLTLQILGDASAISLQVYGQIDLNSDEWELINYINMSTLNVGTSITSKGIYVFPIEGIAKIKFKLQSVTGGEASVFCRISKGD